jgi:hypothetical protein
MWRSVAALARMLAVALPCTASIVHTVPASEYPVRVWMADPSQWIQYYGLTDACRVWPEVCAFEPGDRFLLYYRGSLAGKISGPRADLTASCSPWVVRGQWTLWNFSCPPRIEAPSDTLSLRYPDPPDIPVTPIPEPAYAPVAGALMLVAWMISRRRRQTS